MIRAYQNIIRRRSRAINIGNIKIGDGAPISVVNDEHFRVHYYDRDGKRQVLDYIKQS